MSGLPLLPPIRSRELWQGGVKAHTLETEALGYRDEAVPFSHERDFDEMAERLRAHLIGMCAKADRAEIAAAKRYRPVAICGAWGSGKTSFVNRVLGKSGFEYAFFEPWQFSGTNGLLEQFFYELEGIADADTAVLIERYQDALSSIVKSGLQDAGIPTAAGVVESIMGAVGPGHGRSARHDSVRGLRDLKERIEAGLGWSGGGRPKIVVIDNIDRLTPDEISQMFRFVNAVVDFPGILYILLFDRDVVCHALGRAMGFPEEEKLEQGRRYLDKIVSLRIDLPFVDMEQLIRRELRSIAPKLSAEPDFCRGLAGLFESPRALEAALANCRAAHIVGEPSPLRSSIIVGRCIRETQGLLYARLCAAGQGRVIQKAGRSGRKLDLDALIRGIRDYPALLEAERGESGRRMVNLGKGLEEGPMIDEISRVGAIRGETANKWDRGGVSPRTADGVIEDFLLLLDRLPSLEIAEPTSGGVEPDAGAVSEMRGLLDSTGGRLEAEPDGVNLDLRLSGWLALRLAGIEAGVAGGVDDGPDEDDGGLIVGPVYPLEVFLDANGKRGGGNE